MERSWLQKHNVKGKKTQSRLLRWRCPRVRPIGSGSLATSFIRSMFVMVLRCVTFLIRRVLSTLVLVKLTMMRRMFSLLLMILLRLLDMPARRRIRIRRVHTLVPFRLLSFGVLLLVLSSSILLLRLAIWRYSSVIRPGIDLRR